MEEAIFNEEILYRINKIFEENEKKLYKNINYLKYEKRLSEIMTEEEEKKYKNHLSITNNVLEIQQLYYFMRKYENSLMYQLGLEDGKLNKKQIENKI